MSLGNTLSKWYNAVKMTAKYSKSFVRVDNPYKLLALNVFLETFRNIESYYKGAGTIEERIEGRRAIRWIRRMEGNFRILAIASEQSLEMFHDRCLKKINDIRREVYESRRLGE